MPMFRARMTEHSIQEPIRKEDGLGFAFDEYDEPRAALLYITEPTRAEFNQNEFYANQYDATAFTFDSVPLGSLVDKTYRVEDVSRLRQESVLSLTRVGGAHA